MIIPVILTTSAAIVGAVCFAEAINTITRTNKTGRALLLFLLAALLIGGAAYVGVTT